MPLQPAAYAESEAAPQGPFLEAMSISLKEAFPVFCLLPVSDVLGDHCLVTSCGISGDIDLWDLEYFSRRTTLKGHMRQVTAVAVDKSRGYLFSAGRDGIKTWDLRKMECVGTSTAHRGAIYAMAATQEWLLAGGQDTVIHCHHADGERRIDLKGHLGFVFAICIWDQDRFFSGGGEGVIILWVRSADGSSFQLERKLHGHTGAVLNLVMDSEFLYSASRDGSIKIWDLETLLLTRSLVQQEGTEMLTVTCTENILYAGSSKDVWAWSKPSLTLLGSVPTKGGEVVSLAALHTSVESSLLFVGGSKGDIRIWRPDHSLASFEPAHHHHLHLSHRMALELSPGTQKMATITPPAMRIMQMKMLEADAESDGLDETPLSTSPMRRKMFGRELVRVPTLSGSFSGMQVSETIPQLLSKFVAIRTVSGDPAFRSECFTGAKWLKNLCVNLGYDARLDQPSDPNLNPLVYARLGDHPTRKTVVIYGHYDVVPAGPGWSADPWTLRGHNGYLYGRGTTDNKGPMLAAMVAASQLMASGELSCNVRFLVEGEEENGSAGVIESVEANASSLAPASLLLISNNYWIGEDRPCIIYGLRGVIYFDVRVTGPKRANHSGVEGGVFREPMVDLVQVLSSLTDAVSGRVKVHGFYDHVRKVTEEEKRLYEDIDFDMKRYARRTGLEGLLLHSQTQTDLLMQRWRFPSMSITDVDTETGGFVNATIIPKQASARVSIRTVPDQNHPEIIASFQKHLQERFDALGSRNSLAVTVVREGAWWLGDMTRNPFFSTTADAIEKVWGQKPMFTREGGTIPILSQLEKQLDAQGLILPLGQSDDNAHLANERISLKGLLKGVEIFKEIFRQAGSI